MKKRILFPILAVLFALSASFATEVMKDDAAVFSSVEFKNGSSCDLAPNCTTAVNSHMCSNTYQLGSNCKTPITSWRP